MLSMSRVFYRHSCTCCATRCRQTDILHARVSKIAFYCHPIYRFLLHLTPCCAFVDVLHSLMSCLEFSISAVLCNLQQRWRLLQSNEPEAASWCTCREADSSLH